MFSTGELATRANISRRTLHYYDEIGLLKPTKVDDKNYRYYDQHALLRLQEIQLLKSIGFTLPQIKQMIDKTVVVSGEEMWNKALQNQINLIQKEIKNLERKQYYLQSTVHAIREINAAEIFALIKSLEDRKVENGVIPAIFPNQLFTDEELKTLDQLPVFGSEDPRLIKIIELLQQIRQNMNQPVSNAIMQEFAKELHVQMAFLFQENTALMEKYWKLITPKENEVPIVYGLDHEIAGYIDKLMEHYYRHRE